MPPASLAPGRFKCPVCGHVFKGFGWSGVERHWNVAANARSHQEYMPYKRFYLAQLEKRIARQREG